MVNLHFLLKLYFLFLHQILSQLSTYIYFLFSDAMGFFFYVFSFFQFILYLTAYGTLHCVIRIYLRISIAQFVRHNVHTFVFFFVFFKKILLDTCPF